jgi:hypothetical protein
VAESVHLLFPWICGKVMPARGVTRSLWIMAAGERGALCPDSLGAGGGARSTMCCVTSSAAGAASNLGLVSKFGGCR